VTPEEMWEEIAGLPPVVETQPAKVKKVVMRQGQCKPCRITVSIASDGVRVTGTSDEWLRCEVARLVERACVEKQRRDVDAVLGVTWPWPIRAEDVLVKGRLQ
jgi:hypothetical protein